MRIRPVGNCPVGDLSCLGVVPLGIRPGGELS